MVIYSFFVDGLLDPDFTHIYLIMFVGEYNFNS